MTELAYYKGEMLDVMESVDEQLKRKGLTEDRIEYIRMRVYGDMCCDDLYKANCARPVIDYGIPEVKCFTMFLPFSGENGSVIYRDTIIRYCPFCGEPLKGRINLNPGKPIEAYDEEKRETLS